MIYYFIPSAKSPTEEHFEKYKLRYAFDQGHTSVPLKPAAGPNNQSGFIVCQGMSPAYDPDKQFWLPHNEGVHFGWYKNSPPTPKFLQRKSIIEGKEAFLGGMSFIVPIAKSWVWQDGKPAHTQEYICTLKWADGKWVDGEVCPEHEAFATIGEKIFDHWIDQVNVIRNAGDDGSKASFTLPPSTPDMVCDILALNYRLSPLEVSALRLLKNDVNAWWEVLKVMIDLDTYVDLSKKNEPADTQDTSLGVKG